jgi:hypothetical protein
MAIRPNYGLTRGDRARARIEHTVAQQAARAARREARKERRGQGASIAWDEAVVPVPSPGSHEPPRALQSGSLRKRATRSRGQ